MAQEYLKTLKDLAKPLIEAGVYKSEEAFIKDLVSDVASQKIKSYKKTIRKYDAKYGSLEKFSRRIKGKATPKQEDGWMQWEAARNMIKAWKTMVKKIDTSAG